MKQGFFCAGGAFLMSLLLSLVSGAPLPVIFIRAFIFAALFFGLGFGASYIFSTLLIFPHSPSASFGTQPEGSPSGDFGAEFLTSGDAPDLGEDGGPEGGGFSGGGGPEGGGGFSGGGGLAGGGFSGGGLAGGPDTDTAQIDDISALFENADIPGSPEAAAAGQGIAAAGQGIAAGGQGVAAAAGGLEQNTAHGYTDTGSVVNPIGANNAVSAAENAASSRNPAAGYAKTGDSGSTETAFSDFSAFVPGMPGLDMAESPGGMFSEDEAEYGGNGVNASGLTVGTVEMSLRKPKSTIDFSGQDGKKMAGAIQTILKKDKE